MDRRHADIDAVHLVRAAETGRGTERGTPDHGAVHRARRAGHDGDVPRVCDQATTGGRVERTRPNFARASSFAREPPIAARKTLRACTTQARVTRVRNIPLVPLIPLIPLNPGESR